jgi:hypothetical protein
VIDLNSAGSASDKLVEKKPLNDIMGPLDTMWRGRTQQSSKPVPGYCQVAKISR